MDRLLIPGSNPGVMINMDASLIMHAIAFRLVHGSIHEELFFLTKKRFSSFFFNPSKNLMLLSIRLDTVRF